MTNHFRPKRLNADCGRLYVVLFRSRKKDNKTIDGVQTRVRSMLVRGDFYTDETVRGAVMKRFNEFVFAGTKNETSRLYISANARDDAKTRKALIHKLIDEDNIDMAAIEQFTLSLAAKSENAAEHHWLIDCDDMDQDTVRSLAQQIVALGKVTSPNPCTIYQTPHGYHIITEHGFDTRAVNLAHAEVKRDALRLAAVGTKYSTTSVRVRTTPTTYVD